MLTWEHFETCMVKTSSTEFKCHLNVPQTRSIGKLSKAHDFELIKTSECFGMPITLVTVNTFLELIMGNLRDNLRKYGPLRTHRSNLQPLEARLQKYKI